MGWFLVWAGLGIIWLYVVARVVTRAILRTLREDDDTDKPSIHKRRPRNEQEQETETGQQGQGARER